MKLGIQFCVVILLILTACKEQNTAETELLLGRIAKIKTSKTIVSFEANGVLLKTK
jgi:hypothetical protein